MKIRRSSRQHAEIPPHLVTIPGAAKALSISPYTMRRLIRARSMRIVKIGTATRIPVTEIDRVGKLQRVATRRSAPRKA